MNNLANGAEAELIVIDTSSMSDDPMTVKKATIQFCQMGWGDSDSLFYAAIVKDKEGAAPPALDTTQDVIDLRNENKLLRGPWLWAPGSLAMSTGGLYGRHVKTVVLKNLRLDENDDVKLVLTNVKGAAMAATDHVLKSLSKIFWRPV